MRNLGLPKILVLAILLGPVPAALAAEGVSPGAPPPKLPAVKPAEFGEIFPAGTYTNLNAGAGGAEKINLKDIVGKKPVVFCYFLANDSRSETVFQDLQSIVDELGPAKLILYGITTPTGSMDLQGIRERLKELRIHVPVLHDDGPRLAFQLGVLRIPSIAILDAEGRLRLANGGSLKQTLEYKMDLAEAVRRVGSTGQLGTYGALPSYYPAVEMTGKKCPDFEAPMLGDGSVRKWSSLMDPHRINVLIFWSQDCPHCRHSLPLINAWLKQHPEGINVVGTARVANDAVKTKTEEFCKQEGLIFPTLIDQDLKIAQEFLVTSTPTIFIIRPDGIIDSVLLSGEMDYAATFEAKKKQLLKS